MAERKVMERNDELIQKQYVYIDKVKEITAETVNIEGRQPHMK